MQARVVHCPKCGSSATQISFVKPVSMMCAPGRKFSCRSCAKVAYDAEAEAIILSAGVHLEPLVAPTPTVAPTPARATTKAPTVQETPSALPLAAARPATARPTASPPRAPTPPPSMLRERPTMCRWPGCDRKANTPTYLLCARDMQRALNVTQRASIAASKSNEAALAFIVSLWEKRQAENLVREKERAQAAIAEAKARRESEAIAKREPTTTDPSGDEPQTIHDAPPASTEATQTDTTTENTSDTNEKDTTMPTETDQNIDNAERELEERYAALQQSRRVAQEALDLDASIAKLVEARELLLVEAAQLRAKALGSGQ